MIAALGNAWRLPDLRNKLLLTGLILLVYQFAAHVPVVGVDRVALSNLIEGQAGGLIGVLNLLSGGALKISRSTPGVTADIMLTLLLRSSNGPSRL